MSEIKKTVSHLRKARNEHRADWEGTVAKTTGAQSPEGREEKDRIAKLKPMVALSTEEDQYFRAVAEFLNNNRMLEVVDSMTLTMLARNIYQYRMAQEQLTDFDSYVQQHSNGALSPSVAVQLSKMAEDQLLKIGRKLGLSPGDRASLLTMMPREEEQKDDKDDLLN